MLNTSHHHGGQQEIHLPYSLFSQAQQMLAGIEAADYFLANEVCLALLNQPAENSISTEYSASFHVFSTSDQSLLFHLVVALSQSIRSGHACLPISTLAEQHVFHATDADGIVLHQGYVFPALESIKNLLQLLPLAKNQQQLLVLHQQHLYLRRYFLFEHQLAQFIQAKNSSPQSSGYAATQIQQAINTVYPVSHASSNTNDIDWQKVAIANALNKSFSIIAGGPGTGKTYTVTKLLAAAVALKQQQAPQATIEFALVAPTGKAAQRLSESISQAIGQFEGVIEPSILSQLPTQALTIHRLLGYIPGSPNFKYHQDNKRVIDFLLIDEVSMVDLPLLTRVFRALPEHCQVILLGDADQLPSVAVGSVLADLAPRPHPGYSDENQAYLSSVLNIPKTALTAATKEKNTDKKKQHHHMHDCDYLSYLYQSRRFDGEGGIGQLAKQVIAGQVSESWQILTQATYDDVTLIEQCDISAIEQFAKQYYLAIFEAESITNAFEQLGLFRILCATRQGEQGVEHINQQIEQYFTRQGHIIKGQKLYRGMPIMVTENNHRLGIYNGDIGLLWPDENGQLMAFFEDTADDFTCFIPSRLPHFEAVYAMTIHKTQGSEFTHVLMILPQASQHKLLSRELIYTGLTRAKKTLTIGSTRATWQYATHQKVTRYSLLAHLLHESS